MDTLLIANRGEIARRVIRTAKRLGLRTIAVYSDADATMPFVREADDAVCIGTALAKDSYLRQDKIIEAAKATGAQAIHPGYGFLSENAEFAEAVAKAGLIWVGAPAAAIRAMGLKDAAKALMIKAGVPVTPGYLGEDQSLARLQQEANEIGYPILIKAVAGGGGKGMRRVDDAASFADQLASCQREAQAAFGDNRVLLEKYILAPRHIEVQVFGDQHGNVVHLFERDCSLQRRHQKVIEEAPAPGMDEATRHAVCEAAVKAAQAVNYVGAGTIEFIADATDGLRADRIWFMEMNTRLQVEHPVTEYITGQDLVEWQILVAMGGKLPKTQAQLRIHGWAMEARLYAENPATGFLPSIGRLTHLRFPADARVDSGVEQGDDVTPYYDPMIAKLIVHGSSRREAATKLANAARHTEIWPIHNNAGFLARALSHPDFIAGHVDTGFIERHAAALIPPQDPSDFVLQAAAWAVIGAPGTDPWCSLQGFRLNAPDYRQIEVVVNGKPYLVTAGRPIAAARSGDVLFIDGMAWVFGLPRADHIASNAHMGGGALLAPMPGLVSRVNVKAGDKVSKGQSLVVLEAMKMELAVNAPFDGIVQSLTVKAGQQVPEGTLLVQMVAEA